jgi:hypothetical protein
MPWRGVWPSKVENELQYPGQILRSRVIRETRWYEIAKWPRRPSAPLTHIARQTVLPAHRSIQGLTEALSDRWCWHNLPPRGEVSATKMQKTTQA